MNDAGTSEDSAVIQVKAADSPSTMLAPKKIYADTTQIQIGWQAPSDTGYSDVVGYRVYWNEGGHQSLVSTPLFDTMSPDVLSFALYGSQLTYGQTYSLAVTAYNDITESA